MYNFTYFFVSVWNMILHLKGRIQIECSAEQSSDRISGPQRQEVTGRQRKLHNETNSSRTQWEEHVAWKEE